MNKKSPRKISREKFLQLCTRIALSLAGLLGLGGLVRYFSHKPEAGPPSSFNLGPAKDFAASSIAVRPDIPAVIYHTEEGFQAYSLICTHLGCTLEEDGEGFTCPCHGSEFSRDGKVLKGPAGKDLDSLAVEITENGDLVIHAARGNR